MKVSLLVPLVIVMGSTLVAQNIITEQEEGLGAFTQESNVMTSPMMMFGRGSVEEKKRSPETRGELRNDAATRSAALRTVAQRGEELPMIEVPSFKRIISDEAFDDTSFIGHTTGDESGNYVALKNDLSCLPDCLPNYVKACITPAEQQKHTQAALQKMRNDLKSAVENHADYRSCDTFSRQMKPNEAKVAQRLAPFDQFMVDHPYGVTKAAFQQFCVENNITIPERASLEMTSQEMNRDEEQRLLLNPRNNYGSLPTKPVEVTFNETHVEELRNAIDKFRKENFYSNRLTDDQLYQLFSSRLSSSLEVSPKAKELFKAIESKIKATDPEGKVTRDNSWVYRSLIPEQKVITLEDAINKTQELFAPDAP